jgi:hypothetical protein
MSRASVGSSGADADAAAIDPLSFAMAKDLTGTDSNVLAVTGPNLRHVSTALC